VLGSKIDRIDYCRLPALDVKAIQTIHQQILVWREVLHGFDFVTADKPHQESLVARSVAVDDGFSGVNYTLQLRPQRSGSINCQSLTDRHFFSRKGFDRLWHAIFENMKVVLSHVIDGTVISINNPDVQSDQFGIKLQDAALVDIFLSGRGRWLRF